jgi:hypothetical protein
MLKEWITQIDGANQNNTTSCSWDPLDDKSEEDLQKVSKY